KNGENLLEASRRRLLLLGLSAAEIAALSKEPPSKMGLYLLKAPIAGRVVGREITLGDNLEAGTTVFTLADTSLLWVDLSLTPDLQGFVKEGDEAWIEGEDGTREKCRISLISPTLDPSTRTLTLRLELKNPKGFWKPGSYVSGSLRSGERAVPLLVPRSSVQILEGNPVVFVPEGHGFHAHPVVLGERDGEHVEILSGIASGTPVVVRGAFELKAAAVTSSLGSHAGHNH
ncbi:MAG TPA: efflux RND transporter periplasmic adaptor subunit, partial [Candidatus Aminicenantes bacterium]|nr:efflux RND transporter periplasmic adaptor subunit [Candidatus Aminicenantes bacterium]